MQPFHSTTSSLTRNVRVAPGAVTSEQAVRCAAMLLELMPRVMRTIRVGMGETLGNSLSMPQFRVMFFVEHNSGASLSGVAEFLGLSLPSASKLVDHLVKRGLMERTADEVDRRRMTLRLTAAGAGLLEVSHARVRHLLSGVLGSLDEGALKQAEEGLKVLQARFGPGPASEAAGKGSGLKKLETDPRR